MTDVLAGEREASEVPTAPPRVEPRRRRRRWAALVVSVALVAAAVGALLFDASRANDRYDRSRHVLAVTRSSTDVVARDLAVARIDLHLVKQQVGNDSTALSQDTSQLEGARSALRAAQTHVFDQASLLNSLHTCLGGVEQALNALAVGVPSKASDALKWVATPCSDAVNAGG